MEEKCFLRMQASWIVLWLVFALCETASGISCPNSCVCEFGDKLRDNSATCQFNNSTLNVTWLNDFNRITLRLTCKNAYKGLKYECSELPQIPLYQEEARLIVQRCGPGVLRCASGVARSRFISAELVNIITPYESEDLINLQHVNKLKINLKYNDVEFPAVAINSLNSLNECVVTGGNLQLSLSNLQHPGLQYLQLQQNNIKALLPHVFSGLPNLKFLEIRENFLERLGPDSFKGLSSLENLMLEKNRVKSIEADTFSSLKQLSTLDIKDNKLELVPNGLFTGLDNLYEVRFRMNRVELKLDTHAFADLPPSIRMVTVSTSKVTFLSENLFNGSTNIHQLYLQQNEIERLPSKLLSTNTELRHVDFSNNKIIDVPRELFSTAKGLEHINLSQNNISFLKGDIFTHSPILKEVSLEHNRISHMDRDIFNGTTLRSVTVANNNLRRIVGDSSPGWSTKKLNLSHNELAVFEDWFMNLRGLEYLDLSSNRIKVIKESHIHHSKSKVTIDLRHNNITEILRDMGDRQVSRTTQQLKLHLSNNPITCDCIVSTLLNEWHKYNILTDFNEIICSNNEKLSSLDITKLCGEDETIHPMILSSIVGILIIIITLLLLCIHRYKMQKLKKNLFEVNKSKEAIKAAIDNSRLKIQEDYRAYY